MPNLLDKATGCDNGDRAAKIIQDALRHREREVANYCFPKASRRIIMAPDRGHAS